MGYKADFDIIEMVNFQLLKINVTQSRHIISSKSEAKLDGLKACTAITD